MGQSSGGGRFGGGLGVAPAVTAKLQPAAEKYGSSVLGSTAAKASGASPAGNGGTRNPASKTSKLR